MEFVSKYFDSDRFHIHYQCGGEGTPVLLIHGYGEDSNIWKNIAEAFTGCRMIMPDFPGFGKSPHIASYSLEEIKDVYLKLLDEEGVDRFFIFGHSMGGYTASEFVKYVPKQLLGVGMIHTHPFGDTDEIKLNRKKREEHIEAYGLDGFLKEFYPLLFGQKYADDHPEVVEEMRTYGSTLNPVSFIAGMKAMRLRPDNSEYFKQFQSPVLFLVGDDDRAVPPDLSLKQLSLPAIADVNILEGIGHMSMLEVPDRFVKIVKNYFRLVQQMSGS